MNWTAHWRGRAAHWMGRAGRFEDALEKIHREEGKVCDEYETCNHRACQSSYTAWAIADEALKR